MNEPRTIEGTPHIKSSAAVPGTGLGHRSAAQVPRRLRPMATPKPREPKRAGAKGGTATSNFGVGKRESHDASAFYERFEAPELTGDDDVPPVYDIAEPFVEGDARHMDAVLDN